LLPVIGHVFVCLLNRCCLWSVMYLCACWIVVACYRSCIRPQRFNKNINTWPITGNSDSTSTQIHERSQATTIQQAHKYMTDHRPQRSCWIVVACYRSSIYLLVESLWPLIGHICVCLLNRCGLLSVMYLSANGIVDDRSEATTIQQAHKYMTNHWSKRFH
jgi:hypothetical protein